MSSLAAKDAWRAKFWRVVMPWLRCWGIINSKPQKLAMVPVVAGGPRYVISLDQAPG